MKIKNLVSAFAAAAALLAPGINANAQTPRPEYPRPQFERAEWVNLNGTWSYSFDFGRTGAQKGWSKATSFDGKITVPFCPESSLSGVKHTDFINSIWYQRTLNIPAAWDGKQVMLNFGAVDYEAHVFIDGQLVRLHNGTGSSFSCDITKYVQPGHSHNLVVQVNDNLRDGKQPGGKQCFDLNSGGCMYTRVTGIWQTVWMEAVDKEGLKSVFATPDIDQKQLVIRPQFYAENAANKLVVTLYDGNKAVAKTSVTCGDNSVVVLPVKNMKLWSPESPFLYGLKYQVVKNGKVIDEVNSYAGMRKVHLAGGYFYLNNKPYYQRLVLDQGYYPDGIWTAPTDEALKKDIEMSKAVGFNGARLHQKSFEERYYYWADKLGYLTWGESASWGLNVNNEEACRNFISEWAELVERDRNHPSLVTWTPLNETWSANNSGVYTRFVQNLYDMTKALDGTRPVNDASGDSHIKTDIWSVHNYERQPDKIIKDFTFEHGKEPYRNMRGDNWRWLAKYEGQPYMLDEWGGLAYILPEKRHGDNAWGYGGAIDNVEDFYTILRKEVEAIKACKHITGFCYTQITDVEQEQNGIYNYDRTSKFDTKRIKEIFELIPS
ncbi:MAG: beta-glucuronidase, partial [Prevotella sp.]|nr:beta-glucuronidase [Prevotella sp.]MDY5685495.1 glycoside hydrolase family 2 TIM barrel-domain containing protein [Prevotella sp.]